jgi:hypothetical protein
LYVAKLAISFFLLPQEEVEKNDNQNPNKKDLPKSGYKSHSYKTLIILLFLFFGYQLKNQIYKKFDNFC